MSYSSFFCKEVSRLTTFLKSYRCVNHTDAHSDWYLGRLINRIELIDKDDSCYHDVKINLPIRASLAASE